LEEEILDHMPEPELPIITPYGLGVRLVERILVVAVVVLLLGQRWFSPSIFNMAFLLFAPFFLFRGLSSRLIYQFRGFNLAVYLFMLFCEVGKAMVVAGLVAEREAWPMGSLLLGGGALLGIVGILGIATLLTDPDSGGKVKSMIRSLLIGTLLFTLMAVFSLFNLQRLL
jgi:hypothetical protein